MKAMRPTHPTLSGTTLSTRGVCFLYFLLGALQLTDAIADLTEVEAAADEQDHEAAQAALYAAVSLTALRDLLVQKLAERFVMGGDSDGD